MHPQNPGPDAYIAEHQYQWPHLFRFPVFAEWSSPPCIPLQTLQEIVLEGDVNNQLMFAGHNAFQFAKDPYYANGFIPTTKELVDRIITGK